VKLFIFIDGSYLFKASNQNGFHYNIKELPNGLAKRLNYNFNLIKTYYYCSVPDPEYEDDIGKIAVDMLSQAYNNAYDVALLLTGDSDFVPAIEKVKALGKIVYCAAFKNPPFDKLAKACDGYILLNNKIGGIYPRK